MTKTDIFEKVKQTLIEGIEKDGLNWFKPWKNSRGGLGDWRPINRKTGQPYKGMNVWFLGSAMNEFGYEHNEWVTYKNAQDLGGSVRKGESSTEVFFWNIGYWNPTTKKVYKSIADAVAKGEDKNDIKQFFTLKVWNVFNIAQCDDIEPRNPSQPIEPEEENIFSPIEEAERIIAEWATKPPIRHGGDSAHYSPSMDYVQMPEAKNFVDSDSYYKTLFHELVHSTGHEKRLKRKGIVEFDNFGSDRYAMEELVAESGSMMLTGLAGLSPKDSDDNSVAYVKNWSKRLKQEPSKAIVGALTQSAKAVELIMGE